MEGLDKFREAFEAYPDNYVIIGGTASELTDGIRHADSVALVALKMRAYLNLLADKAEGKHVNTKDIKKHRSDVLKNVFVTEDESVIAPQAIVNCAKEFVMSIRSDWDELGNYQQVIVVPGNHEFYKGFDLGTLEDGFDLEIRPNVHAYYNKVVRIEDVDFIVSTLWSKIELKNAYYTERCITDFHRIVYKGERFNFSDFNQEHERCASFIKRAVEESDARKKVVVTHHVPSFELNSKDFEGSELNGAFTVEMGNYIANADIDYWIYGHSHRNIDKIIGDTRCVSNQLGYTFHNEHKDFRPDAVIEI